MSTTRREFLSIVAALGGAFGALGAACGGDDDIGMIMGGRDSGGGGGSCTRTATNIMGNHTGTPHSFTVSVTQVTAAAPQTYDITGAADHSHSVTLSAAQFRTLQGGGSVTSTSTSAGHAHSISVSCS